MQRLTILLIGSAIVSQVGCQNFGTGGYPMQSVTRVPPPGTGSYPVGGGYYGGPAGAQTSVAPTSLSTPGYAENPGGSSINSIAGSAGSTEPLANSYVAQAQYTASPPNVQTENSTMFDGHSSVGNQASPPAYPPQHGFDQSSSATLQQPASGAPISSLQWQ